MQSDHPTKPLKFTFQNSFSEQFQADWQEIENRGHFVFFFFKLGTQNSACRTVVFRKPLEPLIFLNQELELVATQVNLIPSQPKWELAFTDALFYIQFDELWICSMAGMRTLVRV